MNYLINSIYVVSSYIDILIKNSIADTFSIEKMKSLPLVHAEDINKSWLALSQLKPTDLEAS